MIIFLFVVLCSRYGSKDKKGDLPEIYPFTPWASSEEYLNKTIFSLDKNGILTTDYGNNYNKLGKFHNPLFIAVYANILYKEFFRGDKEKRDGFLKQVDWLIDNSVKREDMVLWEYYFPHKKFKASPPWISGLTQGVILNILVRAYVLTGNKKYIETARKVFTPFTLNMHMGGLRSHVPNRGCFYEEVAKKGIPSAKILNGHIGALVGLWDYYRYTKIPEVKKAFDRGVRGLKWGLDKFDAKGTSYYSLKPKIPVSLEGYNAQHIRQLLWLYKVTNDPFFLKYAIKFNYYIDHQYKVKVKGATQSKKHGKENLYLQFGNHYWSHNDFPTWVELDLGVPKTLTGITIFGGLLKKSFPKDFDILFSLSGKKWGNRIEVRDNKRKVKYLNIEKITARFIKMEIFNDNGNENVILTGFGIEVTSDFKPLTAIVNFGNFASKIPRRLIDGNLASSWKRWKAPGWFIIDLHKSTSLENFRLISGVDNKLRILKSFQLYWSTDLDRWQKIFETDNNMKTHFYKKLSERKIKAQYLKFVINQNEVSLFEIMVNKKDF